MQRIKRTAVGLGLVGLLAVTACGDQGEVDPEAYPEQDIEILVGFGPGGGTDVFARQMASIVEAETDSRVQVVNMEGAGGANAIREADNRAPDGYTWVVDASLAALSAQGEFGEEGHEFLRPIARFQDEIVHIMVDPEQYNDWDEMAQAAEGGTVRLGGVGVGTQADIVTMELQAESGLNIEYVPFDGAGELLAAVQGGNVDGAAEEIGAWIDQIESDEVRPILAMHEERIEGFEDIPTSVETGYDVLTGGSRGVLVNSETDDEIASEIESILQDVYESDAYQDHEEELFINLREGWLDSEEYGEYLGELEARISTLMDESDAR